MKNAKVKVKNCENTDVGTALELTINKHPERSLFNPLERFYNR